MQDRPTPRPAGPARWLWLALTGLATGCVDAVREGAVAGAGSVAETAVASMLGFFTVGLEVALELLRNMLSGGGG